MKLLILNKKSLNPEDVAPFEEVVNQKAKALEQYLSRYSKSTPVEVYISKSGNKLFRISVLIRLRKKLLYFEDKGSDALALVRKLFDKLKTAVRNQVSLERGEHILKRKARRKAAIREFFRELEHLYSTSEREQFNHLMEQLMPSLKQYVLRYLKLYGAGIKVSLTLDEIIDEVYLALYDKFASRPTNADALSEWVYQIAHQTMKKIIQAHSDKLDVVDLQTLVKREMEAMAEKYTVDAGGSLVMVDELDEVSYMKTDFGTEIIPEEVLAEYPEIDETDYNFHEEVMKVLEPCSNEQKLIFELYWLDALTEKEIAKAMGVSAKKVKQILADLNQKVIEHFKQKSHGQVSG